MSTPSMQELIARLEKLGIASTAPSTIAQRKESGPYDPPVLPPTLQATISEICQQDEVNQERYPTRSNPKLPQIDLHKGSRHRLPEIREEICKIPATSRLEFRVRPGEKRLAGPSLRIRSLQNRHKCHERNREQPRRNPQETRRDFSNFGK